MRMLIDNRDLELLLEKRKSLLEFYIVPRS